MQASEWSETPFPDQALRERSLRGSRALLLGALRYLVGVLCGSTRGATPCSMGSPLLIAFGMYCVWYVLRYAGLGCMACMADLGIRSETEM